MNSPVFDTLRSLLERRILILDGAMGTMIQRHKLTEADFRGARFAAHPCDLKGDSDVLVLTRPTSSAAIHHEYLAAGADIIETNTFGGTAVAQADYALDAFVYEMNVEGARLARAAADAWTAKTPDRPRFVAGAMGPTNRTLSISPDVNNPAFRAITFDGLRAAFEEQVRGLIDGGADVLLLETIFDTLGAKAAIVAIENVFEEKGVRLPLMISVTITDRSGRTLSGQTRRRVLRLDPRTRSRSASASTARSARATCARTWPSSRASPSATSPATRMPVCPTPSANTTNSRPETAALLSDFATSGFVNMLGGCCGTTPEHIAAIARAVEGVAPRPLPSRSPVAAPAASAVPGQAPLRRPAPRRFPSSPASRC